MSVRDQMSRHPASITNPFTPRAQRSRQQFTKISACTRRRRSDDEDAPWIANLNRDVNHQIIPRRERHGNGGPGLHFYVFGGFNKLSTG